MTRRRTLLSIAVALCAVAGPAAARADFRDGTIFSDTAANGRLDVGPLFVFRSPANANNTVFVMTVSPFTGVLTPTTFVKGARYDIAIDVTGDAVEDMVLRTTFGAASASDGTQPLVMRCLPKPRCRRAVIARGRTGQNLPVPGGGTLRAADQDNPEFFDQSAWDGHAAAGLGTFPRSVGTAKNFYGPNANCLAIVLELPSLRIPTITANATKVIGVWARSFDTGARKDREGRPFTNTGMIPRLPRNSTATERRDAFNLALPDGDLSTFTSPMKSVLTSFYSRSDSDATFLANAWLPDMLMFQIGNPNGFGTTIGPGPGVFTGPFPGGQVLGNGRRFGDDVHDITLNILSNGATPTDNRGDDNGLGVTDGSVDPVSGMTRAIAFPYIAAPHSPPAGPTP